MASTRILIVDDEPIARQILREHFDSVAGTEIVGEAEDGLNAGIMIRELHPDVVFLDLQMPGKGGFDIIREISGPNPPVIVIVTAYDQYAIRAFEAGAIDYLLKPVRKERLSQSLDRARLLLNKPQTVAENVVKLQQIADVNQPALPRKIVGKAGAEYFLLEPNEVLAFHAEGELVWILTPKRRYLATQTLKALEERLTTSNFQRVHRGTLVNVRHVRKMSPLSSQRWLLTLANDQEFVVSRRQARVIRDMLS